MKKAVKGYQVLHFNILEIGSREWGKSVISDW
jgi:hypothetical protein